MIAVKSVLLSVVLAATVVAAAQPKSPQPQSQAKPPAQLELFGVQLKSATREQLREVFEAGGLQRHGGNFNSAGRRSRLCVSHHGNCRFHIRAAGS